VTQGQAAHHEIACIRIYRLFLLDPAAHIFDEFDIKSSGEAAGDFVLHLREVGAIGVNAIGPDMCAAFGVDQLRVHSNLVAGPPDATFEYIADAELTADLLRVDRLSFISKSSIPSDDKTAGDPG